MTEQFNYTSGTTSITTDVTAGTPANTKGSWTTIGTATADFGGIELVLWDMTLTDQRLYDVRIGGTTVVLENAYFFGQSTTIFVPQRIFIPFSGLSGDTIEVRTQATAALAVTSFEGRFLTDLPFTPANITSSYGADTAASRGTTIDTPDGVANTEGTKVELTTSGGLDEDTDFLLFCFSGIDSVLSVTTSLNFRLYTDATGSTFSGIQWFARRETIVDFGGLFATWYYVDRTVFAAGTRVWISAQSTNIDENEGRTRMTMHGYQITPAAAGGGLLRHPGMQGGVNA